MADYLLRDVPGPLWKRVGRRAKGDRWTLRSVLLALLEGYAEGRLVVRDGKIVAAPVTTPAAGDSR